MTRSRLSTRLGRLLAGWQATVGQRLDAMTDGELGALIGPGADAYIQGLSNQELLAQARELDGGAASQRFARGYAAWRKAQGL
jgi:hypothetical protein